MAIARPTKRQIKITSNQRKEIELDFFGIESFCMPKVNLFLKNEDKNACLLLLFLNTKITHSSFASLKQTGKSTEVLGFFGFYCLDV